MSASSDVGYHAQRQARWHYGEAAFWLIVLACGFASAGAIDSAKSRRNPAVHVVIVTGSLVIRVLIDEGRLEQPRL